MLDYDLFCNIFDNMIEDCQIYNKYNDSDKESFYNKYLVFTLIIP